MKIDVRVPGMKFNGAYKAVTEVVRRRVLARAGTVRDMEWPIWLAEHAEAFGFKPGRNWR